MNAERLLVHYERIADAPDAIARLRRFILDLAVRGKLVPQNSSDQPLEGFRKLANPAAPFALPDTWKWIKIGDQLHLFNGMAFKPTDWQREGLRIVRIQNLNNPKAPFNFCNTSMARERSLIDDGSFLISWSGTPGTSFGAFIWDRGRAVLNQHIFRCDFKTEAYAPKFLRLAINGRLDEMIAKAHGGVGLQHITKGKLEALLIPLPPLAEQHRIVAKVDELMVLCDRLEAARVEREKARDRLTAASLARLNAPDPNTATFVGHARFALDNLAALTTRLDQIKQLRQTILNLAVRGKLVPQDPSDEPAAELLKRIAKQFLDLVARGELNKPKTAKPLSPDHSLFDLPIGWSFARFNEIASIQSNLVDPSGYPQLPHIAPDNIEGWTGRLLEYTSVAEAGVFSGKHKFSAGVLLYSKIRPNLAKVAKVDFEGLCSADMYPIYPMISRDFLLKFMITSDFVNQAVREDNRVAMPKINQAALSDIVVTVPPLAEQHRIVAKVDELMALCDRLEASLTTTTATRRRLLDALLADALEPDDIKRDLEAAE